MKKFVLMALTLTAAMTLAGDDIELPKPVKTGGKPLMEVLAARQSERAYSSKEIPMQTLSSLLWAANGVTRSDGRRTAPSALNSQCIDLYVVLKQGTYLYDAMNNKLVSITDENLIPYVGPQDFALTAPLTVILTGDAAKVKARDKASFGRTAGTDSGYVSQNIYLFCTSEGLSTVARSSITEVKNLGKKLKLPKNKEIFLAHSVGYPQETDDDKAAE